MTAPVPASQRAWPSNELGYEQISFNFMVVRAAQLMTDINRYASAT